MTNRLISHKSREWGRTCGGFDSTHHAAIWRSLRHHSVSEQYICLLKDCSLINAATVLTDVESDEFGITRATKQGDPLSSLSFNSFLQSATEKDMEPWKDKGLGIELSDERRDCTSNQRFVDDVLMMAASLKQLKKMIADLKITTEAQGLEIHPEKIQILTNQETNRTREVEIEGMHVETLPPEGEK